MRAIRSQASMLICAGETSVCKINHNMGGYISMRLSVAERKCVSLCPSTVSLYKRT